MTKLPLLHNLKIGQKLIIGFGLLVFITLVVIGISYFGSNRATTTINTTGEIRVPAALIASRAQANLLRMLSDVRGYLALGDQTFRDSYKQNQVAFAQNLAELEELSPNFITDDKVRLVKLQVAFGQWLALPDKLFALRDDQLEREPAYRLLATDGSLLIGTMLIDINTMIKAQSQREPTPANLALLGDMADYQGTLASMFSALRGYVTTRNRIFRQEYEVNGTANAFAWQRLTGKTELLDSNQQTQFADIKAKREQFTKLPDKIFTQLESDQWRADLYLFKSEAIPRADTMQDLLNELTLSQQNLLQKDLTNGRRGLVTANQRMALGGFIALISGLILTLIFRENIAGPIGRLTQVADMIRNGDLQAQATIESKDEIGILAKTFNNMTKQLRDTLFQVQTEKERADNLLDVVIPIGVQLSSEKDFNRLLETMLVKAQDFCHADAGTLYLRTPEDELEAVIVRNKQLGLNLGGKTGHAMTISKFSLQDIAYRHQIATQTVLQGITLNIPDRHQDSRFNNYETTIFGPRDIYRTVSYLSVPLKTNENKVIGAMQLINAQNSETNEIIPFDENIQQLMESYSSLAVAALEAYQREQSLRQEITQLRIQIDESKREQAVKAIVETEGFAELQAKAQSMRERRQRRPTQSDVTQS